MPQYVQDTSEGPYSIYSRGELSQEQIEQYITQHSADSKPLVNTPNGPVMISSPGQQYQERNSAGPNSFAMRRWYEQNIAAPVSNAVQSFTQNPTTQQGIGAGLSEYAGATGSYPAQVKGLETPQAQQAAGQGFLQPLEKGITGVTDDPAMLAMTLGSVALPLAGVGSFINPVQKLLPSLAQRAYQMVAMPVAMGGIYGTSAAVMNPNATSAESLDKGAKLATLGIGLNIVSRLYGRFFNGPLDVQLADSITSRLESTFESQGTRIATNPQQWLREVRNVLEDSAQQKLTATTARITDYVKAQSENNPQVLSDFTSSMTGLQQAIVDLGRGDSTAHTRVLANLDRTMQLVQGIRSAGSPLTQPSDTVMAYLFSKDPTFMAKLVRAGAINPSSPSVRRITDETISGAGDYAQELLRAPSHISNIPSSNVASAMAGRTGTEIPLWQVYATPADMQRVLSNYSSQVGNMGTERTLLGQQQLGLDAWKRTVGQQALEMLELEKARQITEAALKPGIVSGVEMQRAALDVAKRYASPEAQVRSAIEAVYSTGVSNIQKLQYVNPRDLPSYGVLDKTPLRALREYKARATMQPAGLSRFLPGSTGAINLQVSRELQKINTE